MIAWISLLCSLDLIALTLNERADDEVPNRSGKTSENHIVVSPNSLYILVVIENYGVLK